MKEISKHFGQHRQPPGSEIAWAVDDSSFESYVSLVEFHGFSARDYLLNFLTKNQGGAALDIAGGTHGKALADLINGGHIASGIHTNFSEPSPEFSEAINQRVVTGDLLRDYTWQKIKKTQLEIAPEGFLLALHRPYGGLQDLTWEEYSVYLDKVFDLVQPGGVIYSQIPRTLPYEQIDQTELESIYKCTLLHPEVDQVYFSTSNSLSNHRFCIIEKRL